MQNSGFATLSAEMRNHIYGYVVPQRPIQICYVAFDNDHQPCTPKFILHHPQAGPALAQVCRAFWQESTQMYYANNTFVLNCGMGTDPLAMLQAFIAMIGPSNAQALRSAIIVPAVYTGVELTEQFVQDLKNLRSASANLRQITRFRCQGTVLCQQGANRNARLDVDIRNIDSSLAAITQELGRWGRELRGAPAGEVNEHRRDLEAVQAELREQ